MMRLPLPTPLAIAGVAFASATLSACNDDAATRATPTATVLDPDATAAASLTEPTDESDFNVPNDPRLTADVVEGILPSPAETSAVLGLPAAAWELKADLGQEFEGMNFKTYGVTAGWVAFFRAIVTPAADGGLEGMYVSLAFHGTPEDAARTFQYVGGVTGVLPEGEDTGELIADAVSMMTGASTVSGIIIRQSTVTAAVVMLHAEGRDAGASLRDFAQMLARGIDEFVRAQGT